MRQSFNALALAMLTAVALSGCNDKSSSNTSADEVYFDVAENDLGRDLLSNPSVTLVTNKITSISAAHGTIVKLSSGTESAKLDKENNTVSDTGSGNDTDTNAETALTTTFAVNVSADPNQSVTNENSDENFDSKSSNTKKAPPTLHDKTPTGPDSATWRYTLNASSFKNHEIPVDFVETFTLTTTDGQTMTSYISFAPKDTLMPYAWHLYNDGTSAKALGCGSTCPDVQKGFDLNIIDAWQHQDTSNNYINGKGVVVAIADTPIDIEHRDLKNNVYTPKFSQDKQNNNGTNNKNATETEDEATTLDSSGINQGLTVDDIKNDTALHGTMVAGIIAASGENGGTRGEAFRAQFYSIPLTITKNKANNSSTTNNPNANDNVYPLILAADKTDVVNQSYNLYNAPQPDDQIKSYLDALYEAKIPLVKSSGNNYLAVEGFEETGPDFDTSKYDICTKYEVDRTFEQFGEEASAPASIIVGAAGPNGSHLYYSSTGPQLWLTGLSGEFGVDDSDQPLPGIVTTASHFSCLDLPTQDANGEPLNLLADGKNSKWRTTIDPTCNYTSVFNGTSAAAPTVTGIVALLKQVNLDFTVPQIKYLLATSASNDETWSTLKYTAKTATDFNDESIVTDDAWQNNGAGVRYSNMYGFGLANATEAVKLAQNCSSDSSCTLREKLPLDVISTSKPDCEVVDSSRGLYECTFSDLKELTADGEKVDLNGPLEIESTRVNVYGFKQKIEEHPRDKLCTYKTPDSNSSYRTDYNYYYYATTHLALNLSSPKSADRVLKPYLAYWYYDRSFFNELPSQEYYLQSNAFYREQVMPSDTWKLTIKSSCALDMDSLNESIHLKLKTYKVEAR